MFFCRKKHSLKNKGEVHWREKFLFYGTQSQSVEAICCRGFNTDLLNSKGISFSEDASFFLDDPGCDRIFLAKVIIREFIEPNHTRSPPANSENEDIHSLFFNDLRPSIYVIYDNSQAYPEYLIEFWFLQKDEVLELLLKLCKINKWTNSYWSTYLFNLWRRSSYYITWDKSL